MAFDTTGNACALALCNDGCIVFKRTQRMDFGQAEALMPMMREALASQSIDAADITLMTVCTGPGSFTGLRSSLAAARSFKIALPNLGLTGVSAFEAYLESFENDEMAELNAVIIETKREDFYVQIFDKNRNKLTEPSALNYDELISHLRYKKVSLIGDGVERFLTKPSGLSLHAIRMEDCLDIEYLALSGLKRYKRKQLDYPKPLYLRAPDVCIKR